MDKKSINSLGTLYIHFFFFFLSLIRYIYLLLLLRYSFFFLSFFGSSGFYLPPLPPSTPFLFFLVSVFVFVFVQIQIKNHTCLPNLLIIPILPLLLIINLHTPHKIQPVPRRILRDEFHEFQSSSIAQYET